jgi:hypothetical protein
MSTRSLGLDGSARSSSGLLATPRRPQGLPAPERPLKPEALAGEQLGFAGDTDGIDRDGNAAAARVEVELPEVDLNELAVSRPVTDASSARTPQHGSAARPSVPQRLLAAAYAGTNQIGSHAGQMRLAHAGMGWRSTPRHHS